MPNYETLLRQFPEPDRFYRPVQIVHHHYPGDPETQDAYIDQALEAGLGGFVVNMGAMPERKRPDPEAEKRRQIETYLDDHDADEWARLNRFVDRCLDHGLKVWLYDEYGFPSGAAADKVIRTDPDFQVRGVLCQTLRTTGGAGGCALEQGVLRSAAAYPALDDDTLSVRGKRPVAVREGRLEWDLPAGDWRICAFLTKKIGYGTMCDVPYVDLLREDVVKTFIDDTHERYKRFLGEDRLRRLEAIFTDEPSIATHGCSSWFSEKYAVAGWTDGFAEEFLLRYGYDVCERFDCLFYQTDTDYQTVRRDYWRLAADAFGRCYFKQIFDWCERNGLASTGHLYGEETLGMQIGLNADLFGLHCRMQMPGVDRLYAYEPRDVIPEKTASSAAHLMGRRRTMSESSFHFEHNFWNQPEEATIENMINSCAYQYVLGINNITSYYPYGKFPAADWARFERCVGRMGSFTMNSRHIAPVLVQIPMTGAWERYMPRAAKYWTVGPTTVSRDQPEALRRLEALYGDTLLHLMDTRRDFDLIDDAGLLQCAARDGVIHTRFERFDRLVVFDTGWFSDETAACYERLLDGGALFEVLPADGALSPNWEALIDWYPGQIKIAAAPDTLCAAVEPVLSLDGCDGMVWVRAGALDDGSRVFLLHNRARQDRAFSVSLPQPGSVVLLWPASGAIEDRGLCDRFPLTLPARSPVLMVAR